MYYVYLDEAKAKNDPKRIGLTTEGKGRKVLEEFDDFYEANGYLGKLRMRIKASNEGIMDDSSDSYRLDFSDDLRKEGPERKEKEKKNLMPLPFGGYDEDHDSRTEKWDEERYAVMRKLDGKPGDPDYIMIMPNDGRPEEGWVAENSLDTYFTDLEYEDERNLRPHCAKAGANGLNWSLVVADDPLSLPADEAYTVTDGMLCGTRTEKGTVIATCEYRSSIEKAWKAVTEVWRMHRPRNAAPRHPEVMSEKFSFLDLSDEKFRSAMIDARSWDPECPLTVIAGSGGSGKSEIYRAVYDDDPHHTLAIALTGFAADTLRDSGVSTCATINKALGIAPQDFFNPELELPDLARTIALWDTILIDEVSMASINMMDMLMRHLAKANRMRGEKGPVKVILFGDPLQLLPVITKDVRPTYRDVYGNDILFFNAPAFRAMKRKTHILHESHRQKDDPELSGILLRMRTGSSTDEDVRILNSRVMSYERLAEKTGDGSIRMLASDNDTVDLFNERKAKEANRGKGRLKAVHCKEYLIEAFDHRPKNRVFPEEIVLHSGDPVIILENDAWHRGDRSEYSNGTTGIVRAFTLQGLPVVRTAGGAEVVVRRTTVSGKEEKFVQLACKLAYAVTYHKAQGLTLDHVYLDLGKDGRSMQEDMVYLGLSRVRTLEGLGLSRPLTKKELNTSLNAEAMRYFALDAEERDAVVPCSMKFRGRDWQIGRAPEGAEVSPTYRGRNGRVRYDDDREDR